MKKNNSIAFAESKNMWKKNTSILILIFCNTFFSSCKNSVTGSDKTPAAKGTSKSGIDIPLQKLIATQDSFLKSSPSDTASLNANQKCAIPKSTAIQFSERPQPAEKGHFQVLIPAGVPFATPPLPNCPADFFTKSVFIYGVHFGLEGVPPGKTDTDNFKTPLADFIRPMTAETVVTSVWCEERGVGTCPHIGVDLAGDDDETKSFAMSNGIIEDIVDVGECGWRVDFKDSVGGLWGYLHRRKPNFQKGQRLYKGDLIGVWYGGNADCVTGPHLHLERFEAGSHGGNLKGFTCQTRNQGHRNCHFDPWTPLKNKKAAATAAEMKSISDQSKLSAAKTNLALNLTSSESELIPLQLHCNKNVPSPENIKNIKTGNWNGVKDSAIKSAANELYFKFKTLYHDENRILFETHAFLKNAEVNNDANNCGVKNEIECIEQWELRASNSEGEFVLFSEQGMRNRKLEINFDKEFCVGIKNPKEFNLIVKTNFGNVFQKISAK